MKILISNDDSIHAMGIKVLFQHLKDLGDVSVVAPLEEKSTTGHSLTIHKPLRMIELEKDFIGVSGSPADCVYLGIREVMKEMPDLVVSGINRGANLGQDVYYSGTVSAAREAAILGIPSIAVSLSVDFHNPPPENNLNYAAAAQLTYETIKRFNQKDFPKLAEHTLLNLNVPDLPYDQLKGVKVTRQGFRHYSGSVIKRNDHRGRPYFWVGGEYQGFRKEQGADCDAVENGFASITPLQLDCTHFESIDLLSNVWDEGK